MEKVVRAFAELLENYYVVEFELRNYHELDSKELFIRAGDKRKSGNFYLEVCSKGDIPTLEYYFELSKDTSNPLMSKLKLEVFKESPDETQLLLSINKPQKLLRDCEKIFRKMKSAHKKSIEDLNISETLDVLGDLNKGLEECIL